MILFLAGGAVLVLTFADFLQTTLGASRAGRMTRIMTAALRAVAKALCRVTGRWVRYTGPLILALLATVRVFAHRTAWVLMFRSDPHSLVLPDGGGAAGVAHTVAFVGASISTLGMAIAEPGDAAWDMAAALGAVNGMVVLTLSVAYVFNLIRTVTSGHELAVLVQWGDGESRDHEMRVRLAGLATQLNSFPLALYFSTPQPERPFVAAVKRFVDETPTEDRRDELVPILAMLPRFEAEDDVPAIRPEIDAWSAADSLAPDDRRSAAG